MVLSDSDAAITQRLDRAVAVEPCWRNESGNRTADNILQQSAPAFDPGPGFVSIQAEELPFTGGHPMRLQAISGSVVSRRIPMEVSVEEDFQPGFGPFAEPGREWAPGDDRRVAPMVGHDEQGDSTADVRRERVDELQDLALETRPDVMNRRKDYTLCHRPAFGRARLVPPAIPDGSEQSFT